MPRIRAPRIVTLALLVVGASPLASPAFAQSGPSDPELLQTALDIAATQTGGGQLDASRIKFEVRRTRSKGKMMGVLPDGDDENEVDSWILVYPSNIVNAHPDCGLSDDYALGVLIALFFHELQHTCMGDGPMTPGRAPNSCKHAAIDWTTHAALCPWVCELESMLDDEGLSDEERRAIEEKMLGACAELRRIEEKWNSEEGAKKMLACLRGETDKPFDPDESSGCPTGYPDDPGTDEFPDHEAIPPCACCDAVLGE